MDLVSDWMNFHELDQGRLHDLMTAWRLGALPESTAWLPCPMLNIEKNLKYSGTQQECLEKLILPAFDAALKTIDLSSIISGQLEFQNLPPHHGDLPHTVDRGLEKPVLIAINWTGSPDDVICLAHEVGHALQILLSKHEQMPPVARETCAFLGELLLIAHASDVAPEMYPSLYEVWHRENNAYLGTDIDRLTADLADPNAPYHYRQNYPVARLAAIEMFALKQGDRLLKLFTSGRTGMQHLPINDIARLAGNVPNCLPPLPEAASETHAIDSYRSLGAMALIDIDYWQGYPEKRIDEYYSNLLINLQARTAFLGVNEQGKPVGYATWSRVTENNSVKITRHAAPFGDHLTLQRMLERHLNQQGYAVESHDCANRQDDAA